MRVLLAPDGFKESMSAREAADAMGDGAVRAAQAMGVDVYADQCPVSDGGAGLVEALVDATGGQLRTSDVQGPLGRTVEAQWGVIGRLATGAEAMVKTMRDAMAMAAGSLGMLVNAMLSDRSGPLRDRTAVIEMSSAAGLHLVPEGLRDPERASTAGVGELLREAAELRCGGIIVGVGNSATCDGGVGMADALGVRFFDERGKRIRKPTGADLGRIVRVEPLEEDAALGATLIVACDVDNPLTGARGAARVFGPQKGAGPSQVSRLDDGLANLARRCAEAGLEADPDAPGAGAAGGLAFGLSAFLGAALAPGAELTLDLLGFDARVRGCDLVLTGEGRLDRQSLGGKATITVARRALDHGAPTVALVGSAGEGAAETTDPDAGGALLAYREIAPAGMPTAEAMRRGRELLAAATERVLMEWASGRL